jgi:nucleoside-specific outer membrane channel protein Tsx
MKKTCAFLIACLAGSFACAQTETANIVGTDDSAVPNTMNATSTESGTSSSANESTSPTAEGSDAKTTASADKAKTPAKIVSINSVYALYTNQAKPDPVYGYGTTTKDLLTFQFEHFSFHPWGDIYFDAENYQGRNVGTPYSTGNNWQSLLVLDPRLSLSKITKKHIAYGPVSDVSLEARFERESYPDTNHFWTRNFGIALNWKVPGFSYFASGVLDRYTNIDAKNTWFWRSVLLSKPGNIAHQHVYFNLLSFINGSGAHKTEYWERADFLWDATKLEHVQAGIRLEYEHYSNDPLSPGHNYNRYLPELMLRYTF